MHDELASILSKNHVITFDQACQKLELNRWEFRAALRLKFISYGVKIPEFVTKVFFPENISLSEEKKQVARDESLMPRKEVEFQFKITQSQVGSLIVKGLKRFPKPKNEDYPFIGDFFRAKDVTDMINKGVLRGSYKQFNQKLSPKKIGDLCSYYGKHPDDLKEILAHFSQVKAAKKLGISTTTLRKLCQNLNIPYHLVRETKQK